VQDLVIITLSHYRQSEERIVVAGLKVEGRAPHGQKIDPCFNCNHACAINVIKI